MGEVGENTERDDRVGTISEPVAYFDRRLLRCLED